MTKCAFCGGRILHTNKNRCYDEGCKKAFCSMTCMAKYEDRINRLGERTQRQRQQQRQQQTLEMYQK
jgi:hypothetical protein